MILLDGAALTGFALALIPAINICRNLRLYLPPPAFRNELPVACSVLIPARNEAFNIERAVRSILQNINVELEVLVGDDHSTDATAGIVRELAAADERVRLISLPSLPAGWCGKQHACHVLAGEASHPLLLFMDADVRLTKLAIKRIAAFRQAAAADLVSGIPRQEAFSFSERLLVPLIHFVLLGFLPIKRMRVSRQPSYAAGCGQLFMVRRTAYHAAGGHARLRDSLHDGLRLPRTFREAGFRTDLFDATGISSCRMYTCGADVWTGLARNAHEGLGSAALIGPATLLLAGGQILPLLMLLIAPSRLAFVCALLTTIMIFVSRFSLATRFQQSWLSALLHPIGVAALLAIQWCAFVRSALNRPARWRDRSYRSAPAV